MRFLVDAQLPPALARWLAEQGHVAEHLLDLGMLTADDRAVWAYARQVGAAIITKDEDFAARRTQVDDGPPVVWIRVGNVSRRELLTWIRFRLTVIIDALNAGESLIEIV